MMKKKVFMAICVILAVLVAMPLMVSCEEASSEDTIKIGVVAWTGYVPGAWFTDELKVMANMDNDAGGLEVDGKKYEVELIIYDSGGTESGAKAAVNRLIYEDEVNFIFSEPGSMIDSWLQITEENKVIVCCGVTTSYLFNPDFNYSFQTIAMNSGNALLLGWFAQNYPGQTDIFLAMPDDQAGHGYAPVLEDTCYAFGLNPHVEYYPASAADLSSLGTKIKEENPDAILAEAGTNMLVYKAAVEAGYEGTLLGVNASSDLLGYMTAEQVEGYISLNDACAYEDPPSEAGQAFKEAYIAEYGEWTKPSAIWMQTYTFLTAAIQEAGTIDDTDAIAEIIGSGLTVTGVFGTSQMVARPDLGNDRTVDCVLAFLISQFQSGEDVVIHTPSMAECTGYFDDYISYISE